MKNEIRAAVERLFSACLDVTLAGHYHAFFYYGAPWNWVEIDVHPSDDDYSECNGPMRRDCIRLDQPDTLAKLNELSAILATYLQEAAS